MIDLFFNWKSPKGFFIIHLFLDFMNASLNDPFFYVFWAVWHKFIYVAAKRLLTLPWTIDSPFIVVLKYGIVSSFLNFDYVLSKLTTILRLNRGLLHWPLNYRSSSWPNYDFQSLRSSTTALVHDSQITLHQLRSNNRKRQTFFNRKREEILRHSTLDCWHFISSPDNPADDSTAGTAPKEFRTDCRWISGPAVPHSSSYAAPPSVTSATPPKDEEATTSITSINQMHVRSLDCHQHVQAISKMIVKARLLNLLNREVTPLLRPDQLSKEELTAKELA